MGNLQHRPSGPQPINIWLESLRSPLNSDKEDTHEEREIKAQKDDAILVLLAKLALVYWRPDFVPSQAKQLYAQFLDDLRDLPLQAIANAVEEYRRNEENKFYPTPGQLRGLVVNPPSWWPSGRNEWMKDVRSEASREMLQIAGSKQARLAAE